MKKKIKYLNEIKKNEVYFFIDDSGTIMKPKQQRKLKNDFKNKEGIVPNDLKAFSVSAVCLEKQQIKKGQRLSKSLKHSFDIDISAPFHRNKMKPNRAQGAFKHLDNKQLFSITRALNKFIKNNSVTFASCGINNYSEVYNGNSFIYREVLRNIYDKLMISINKIMLQKYPNRKAIIIFEGENKKSDFDRFMFSTESNNANPVNKIRTIRFMKKTNKKNIPHFGIELVDYINGSMFSMFGLADFNIHFKNNMDIFNINKLEYLSYIKK